jgi:hypothetical protein
MQWSLVVLKMRLDIKNCLLKQKRNIYYSPSRKIIGEILGHIDNNGSSVMVVSVKIQEIRLVF